MFLIYILYHNNLKKQNFNISYIGYSVNNIIKKNMLSKFMNTCIAYCNSKDVIIIKIYEE